MLRSHFDIAIISSSFKLASKAGCISSNDERKQNCLEKFSEHLPNDTTVLPRSSSPQRLITIFCQMKTVSNKSGTKETTNKYQQATSLPSPPVNSI